MSSKKTAVDWFDLDLERDMPFTDADLAAMERARKLAPLSPQDYQRWVDLIEEHYGARSRNNTVSDEPFTL